MTGLRQTTEGRWQIVLLLAGLLFFTACPSFAIQMTTVRDTVYRADGTAAQGTVLVSWPGFTAADGSTVAAGSTSVTLAADGSLAVSLAPNAGSSPQGTYYTAVYHLSDGTVQKEYWVVPAGDAVSVTQIRAQVVPAAVAQQTVSKEYVDAEVRSLQSNYLQLSGGTLTGALTLPSDPTTDLQAATKQYVDKHVGSGDIPTLSAVISNFSTTTPGLQTLLGTSFDEGTAGATIAGTKPRTYTGSDTGWHFADGTTTWNFNGSGAVSASNTAAPYIGAYIDIGVNDGYTIHANFAGIGTGALIALRADPATGSMVFLNLSGGSAAQWISQVNGAQGQTLLGSSKVLDFTTLSISISGQTVTATDAYGRSLVAGIPSGPNESSTLVGFTNYGGAPATLTSFSVTVPTTTTGLCSGILQSDGKCDSVAANNQITADANKHLNSLPEKGTSCDSMGNCSVAWEEDRANGVFDPRRPINGDGGVNGPNPAQAWQDVADEANCWTAINGRMATINAPAGSWSVGLANEPTLTFGPVNFHGSPGDQYGATRFNAGFNNVPTVQFITPYTSSCPGLGLPAGLMVTNGRQGGAVTNLSEHGCSTGGCTNLPSDNGDPLNQLNQKGIFVGWVHSAEIGPLYAEFNRSTGITISGLDVLEKGGLFSYSNNGFLQVDHGGSTYDPSKDGLHFDVELASGDSRFFHIEDYGFLVPPGKEYGHVASIGLEGGNIYLEDIFPQIGQIGLMRPYGGGFARVHGMRIDAMGGSSVVNADPASSFVQGLFDGYCGANTVPTPCDAISNSPSAPASFAHINITRASFFGPSYATGDIASGYQQHYEDITSDSGAPIFETGPQPGEGVSFKQADFAALDGGDCQTGQHFSVNNRNHIRACNTSPTQILDAPDGLVNQDLWITLNSANDILASQANGGIWATNTGLNIIGPGYYHFTITRAGVAKEQGDPINQSNWSVGHAGLTAEPVAWTAGVLDVAGSAAVRALPPLADGGLQAIGPQSGYQYCFEEVVYVAGGKQSNNPTCGGVAPPTSTGPSNNVIYHGSLPLNWTRYKVYLQSTTDPAFTSMTGVLYDQTAGGPQLPVSDLRLSITSGMTPISTMLIPASGQGVNATGTYNIDPSGTPASSTSPCVPGQVKEAPGVPTGYMYYCDSEDHWIRQTTSWTTF